MNVPRCNLQGLTSQGNSRSLQHHALVGLRFFPHDIPEPIGRNRSTDTRRINWKKHETEGTVTSFRWSKRLGQPSGQWAATVKIPSASTLDILGGDILPGDWMDATINRNGLDFPLLRGVVDTVDEDRSVSEGATILAYNLTGRDHGAPFEMPVVYANVWVQTLQQLTKGLMAEAVKAKVGGSPAEMFETLINAAFGDPVRSVGAGTSATATPWILPKSMVGKAPGRLYRGQPFRDLLKVQTSATRGYYFHELQLWTQPGQTVDATLTQWCNPLLNEWFYDLTPRTSKEDPWAMWATIRERPFILRDLGLKSPWYSLPVLELPEWALGSSKIGRSNHERFNIIELMADWGMSQDEQFAMVPPSRDQRGLEKYGLRPMTESTKFLGPGGYSTWGQERKVLQRLLVDWHAANPFFFSGSQSVRLALPELRVGELFRTTTGTPAKDRTFRVEGIDFMWQWTNPRVPPSSMTALTLTRGYEGTDLDGLRLVEAASSRFQESF